MKKLIFWSILLWVSMASAQQYYGSYEIKSEDITKDEKSFGKWFQVAPGEYRINFKVSASGLKDMYNLFEKMTVNNQSDIDIFDKSVIEPGIHLGSSYQDIFTSMAISKSEISTTYKTYAGYKTYKHYNDQLVVSASGFSISMTFTDLPE